MWEGQITSEIRRHMEGLGYLEIETPVLQVLQMVIESFEVCCLDPFKIMTVSHYFCFVTCIPVHGKYASAAKSFSLTLQTCSSLATMLDYVHFTLRNQARYNFANRFLKFYGICIGRGWRSWCEALCDSSQCTGTRFVPADCNRASLETHGGKNQCWSVIKFLY